MDKRIAGLLGAAAALATVGGANAATTAAPATEPGAAASYRDLLNPVPNALAALKDDDARLARQSGEDVKVAQIVIGVGHHHHHHHHRWYGHHHHHHHRWFRHHHHHHHHHHY